MCRSASKQGIKDTCSNAVCKKPRRCRCCCNGGRKDANDAAFSRLDETDINNQIEAVDLEHVDVHYNLPVWMLNRKVIDDELEVRKCVCLLRHFILNMIILPRQARDKHRESTQKESGVF